MCFCDMKVISNPLQLHAAITKSKKDDTLAAKKSEEPFS